MIKEKNLIICWRGIFHPAHPNRVLGPIVTNIGFQARSSPSLLRPWNQPKGLAPQDRIRERDQVSSARNQT